MNGTKRRWEERFRNGDYPSEPEPSRLLRDYIDSCPEGRALDVATGTGRNAVYLARAGYRVDAIDLARAGLTIARDRARERGVTHRINWIQADIETFPFPEAAYEVITMSFYRGHDRLADLKRALVPGGICFIEHHLRSAEPVDSGSSDDRLRFASNELLHACLDLTVLYYQEGMETRADGRVGAIARIIARKSTGDAQSYPGVVREPPG